MPNDIAGRVARLRELVNEAQAAASSEEERGRCLRLLSFLDEVEVAFPRLQELERSVAELKSAAEALGEPPLEYAVYLGPGGEGGAGCSASEVRHELLTQFQEIIKAAAEGESREPAKEQLYGLVGAFTALLSRGVESRAAVVGSSGHRFEVSVGVEGIDLGNLYEGQEVVLNKARNIVGVRQRYLRGDTAEVLNVLTPAGAARVLGRGEAADQLLVCGPDGQKVSVACDPALAGLVARGDVVELDPERQIAKRKVKPRLHVRAGGNEGLVVEISEGLFSQGVEIGDIVRVDTGLQFAFEKLPSYQSGELTLEEVPDVDYSGIGGLDAQIEEIREAIELPYLHAALFEQYSLTRPKGIFLCGPPGCGKTMIAKAVANNLTKRIREHLREQERLLQIYGGLDEGSASEEVLAAANSLLAGDEAVRVRASLSAEEVQAELHTRLERMGIDVADARTVLDDIRAVLGRENGIRSFFLNVKGPELLNKYVGETEHRIRKIFEEARRRASLYTPVVIFFDEMEAMFRSRGTGRSSDVETTIVPQFLSEMDGVEASEHVIIIGATNRPDMVDAAVLRPGRLDVKVKVDRPDRAGATQILARYLTPELRLSPQGLRRPPADDGTVGRVVFPVHVVEKCLRRLCADAPAAEVDSLLRAIPPGTDVRGLLAEPAAGPGYWNLVTALGIEERLPEVAANERLAEALIDDVVTAIYGPFAWIEAVTSAGKRHSFPLRDFVSGALLAGVVARAKRTAVKREADPACRSTAGLTAEDLHEALRQEFVQNAEQLVNARLERELAARFPGRPPDIVAFVDVYLGAGDEDPWAFEKPRPYLETQASARQNEAADAVAPV